MKQERGYISFPRYYSIYIQQRKEQVHEIYEVDIGDI